MYGFDPECTVMLKGVPAKVELEEVKRAFALLDDVVRVQHIDILLIGYSCSFSNTRICCFSCYCKLIFWFLAVG